MILEPLSQTNLYIFMVVAVLLIPATIAIAAFCGMSSIVIIILNCLSALFNGRSSESAYIIAKILCYICKSLIYATCGVYCIIVIKVIQSVLYYKEVSDYLIIIPLLPVITIAIYKCYDNHKLKKTGEKMIMNQVSEEETIS